MEVLTRTVSTSHGSHGKVIVFSEVLRSDIEIMFIFLFEVMVFLFVKYAEIRNILLGT